MDSIASASAALRNGTLTSVALVERAIEHYARHGRTTNAFITFTPEEALANARACDGDAAAGRWRGPLHGIPISIKDLIDVKGTPTTAGSHVLGSAPVARDAVVVSRLFDAGAISIGKTNLHEFAFGTTGEASAFGAVRNPLDLDRMAGGSSSGSAAAVAAGIGLGSVGTDTGGSIRIPAALCGLVGLKPSYGEVPVDGVVPLCPSFDHVGPIAGSVGDVEVMWRVMSGVGEAHGMQPRELRGLRLGVPGGYFFELLEDAVRDAWDDARARLARRGVEFTPVSIPRASEIAAAYVPIVFYESWAWHKTHIEARPEKYTAPVRSRLEMGRAVTADAYAHALATRDALTRETEAAIAGLDALALPAMPVSAPRLGTTEIAFGGRSEPVRSVMLRLTQLFDITGHPAITLPIAAAGPLPAGFQLAGQRAHTAALLESAKAIEHALR